MDIKAILIISVLCILLGIILLVPGLWWARHKAKKDPAYSKKVNFTFVGWIYIFIMLVLLFAGLLMPYLAPDSYLGQLSAVRFGRLIWAAFIIILFIGVKKVLNLFGLLIEKPEEENKNV